MSDKDINIHVRAEGIEQTKQQVEVVATTLYDYYKAMGDAGNQVEDSTKKASGGLLGMGRILDNITNQVSGFVFGWLSMRGALKILDLFNQKLQKMLDLSKEFYDKTLQIQQVGQSLEFQTSTVGQQRQWGMKALDVQKAGGFADIATAKTLMDAVEVTYKDKGGIKNEQIFNFTKRLAPLTGAAGLNQEGISSLFRIAEQAKVPADINAWNTMVAKIIAGAAGGKMTFDEFLANTGTGTGFTNYLTLGGSLDKAISLYAAAGNVSANKKTGNSLLDLVVQISTSQNKDAAKVIERFAGKPFKDIKLDEQADTVLKYLNSLDPSQRVKILTKNQFPSPADLSKLATPQAQQIIESTQKEIAAADVNNIEAVRKAYQKSEVYKEQAAKVDIEKQKAAMSPEEQAWQRRLTTAKGQFDILAQKSQDRLFIRDKLEPTVMAYEQIAKEAEQIMESAPKGSEQYKEAKLLRDYTMITIQTLTGPVEQVFPPAQRQLYQKGVKISGQLEQFQSAEPNEPNSIIINNNYDSSTHYHPSVGETEATRYDPNAM